MSSQQLPNVDDIINQYKSPESSSFTRRLLGDTAVSAAKGVTNLGQSVVGLADIPTGGYAGKLLEDYTPYSAERTNQFLDELYTPEQQAANREVQNADGFNEALGAALANPSTIGHGVVESLPLMLGGQAIAKGILTKAGAALSPLAAGAIGEGTVTAGSQAEQIRQQTEDRLLTPEQAAIAAGSGVATGGISALSGGIAKQLGIADIDTALLGGQAGKGNMARRFIQSGLTEGVLEEAPQSAQEQVATNIALDKQAMEGVGSATAQGGLLGFAQGGVTGAVFGYGQQSQPTPTPGQTALPPANNTTALPPSPATTQAPAGVLSRAVNQGGLTTAQNTASLALPNLPADELLTFADGSQARASEALAQLASIGYDAQQAQAIVNNLIARQKPATQPQDTSVQSTGQQDLASYQTSQKQEQADRVPASQYARQNFINGLFQDNQQPAKEGLTQEKLPNDLVAEHKSKQEAKARQVVVDEKRGQKIVLNDNGQHFANRREAENYLDQYDLADTHKIMPNYATFVIAYKDIKSSEINDLLKDKKQQPTVIPQPQQKPKPAAPIKQDDDLLTAIAKLGGLSSEHAKAQGIDPADINTRAKVFGKSNVFARQGRSYDDLAESLAGQGYEITDANDLVDKVSRAINQGEKIYTPQGYELNAQRELEQEYQDRYDSQQSQEAKNWQETTTKTQVLANAAGEAQARPAAKNWDELKLREKEDISDKRVNKLSPEQIKQVSDVLLIRPDSEGNYSLDKIKREHPDDIKFAMEQNGIDYSSQSTSQGLDYDNTIPFSLNQKKPTNTHTKTSLSSALRTQLDRVFGKGWFNRLMATGKFKIISSEEAVAMGAYPNAQAFYSPKTTASGLQKDTTYFVYDNISKDKDLVGLALHEISAHALTLGKTQEEFNQILSQLEIMRETSKPVQEAYIRALDSFGLSVIPVADSVGKSIKRNTYSRSDILSAKTAIKELFDNIEIINSSLVSRGVKSSPDKSVFNGTSGAIEFLSNAFKGHSSISKLLNSVDIKDRTTMLSAMSRIAHDDKILDSIVEFIPVDMMNNLVSGKFSADMGLNNMSMGVSLFPINSNNSIPRAIDSADIVFMAIIQGARLRAKYNAASSFDSGRSSVNNSSTPSTRNVRTSSNAGVSKAGIAGITTEFTRSGNNDSAFDTMIGTHNVIPNNDVKLDNALSEIGALLPSIVSRDDVNNEVIAYLLEYHPKLTISQKIMAWFRAQLRKLGINTPMTDTDIVAMATAALRSAPDTLVFDGDVTGAFSQDNNDIRYSFAGENAKTADKYQLSNAQERLANGEDVEQVRKDTGWFKGVDGKWRFEIDDSKAKLKPLNEGAKDGVFLKADSLWNILKHPKLFQAYPFLKNLDVNIKVDPDIKDDNGKFEGSTMITVNAATQQGALSVLLHEIQHAIQNQEGFAKGGSQSQFNHDELLKEANDAFNHIEYVLMPSLFDEYKQSNDPARKEEILQQRRELTALKNQLKKKTPEELSFDKYRRLAGEIEARNTQARLNLTAEQRRNTPPSQTQDIPDSEAIVVWNGTEMHSTLPLNAGNGIRYSFAQAATDYFTGAPRRATTLNDIDTMINTGRQPADKIGWQYYFDKAVTAFTDSTRPFARFVQDTFDSEQASKLLSGADRALGMKAAYEKEAMNKFGRHIADGLRAIMKKVKPDIKGYISDSELYKTAKYLAGMWMTVRYAIDANDWLMQKDQQAVDDLEQEKLDVQAKLAASGRSAQSVIDRLNKELVAIDRKLVKAKDLQAKRIKAINDPSIIDPTKQKQEAGLAGGFNNATAKHYMARIESKIPRTMLEKVANHVYDMNAWKLKRDIQDGKISQATADKFPKYRHYVPLTGDPRVDDSVEDHFATGSVNQAKEKEFKGRTGSLSNNGIDTSFEQLEKSARYHGWNDFKDALAETYDKLIAEKLATGLSQKDAEQAVWDEFDIKRRPETGMVPAGENDITVRKDGKGMIYTINNQAAMEALRSVNNEDTPSVLKPIAAFTRFQARMVTSFMPLFAPNNMLRDVAERSENIRTRKLAGHPNLDMNKVANQAIGNAAKLLAKLKPVMMGVLAENTHLAKVLPMDATNQDVIMLKRFLELGGSSTYGDMLSPDSKSLSEKLRKTGTISDKAMEMIDLYNNAFELISGFSIYKSLVENGVNDKQAATTSLNLMNFRKRGRVMSPLRALYMFAQPIATGGHQMAMTLATRRGQLRYAAYTIAAMALYAMLRSGDDDEELGVNKMDELGNFTLYRNIPIPMGNGQYFKVPVGFGMQQLAWAHGVNAVRTMLGEMTAGEAAAESAALWARSAMPVAPAETAMLKNPMVWFAQTFSPQIAKPLINVALDVNSFGAPLTNARYERQDLAKSLQGRRDTPQLYKDIAQEFGRMGMDIYPEQVREFMRDYGAGAGNEVLKWAVENPAKKERGLSIASPLVDRYVLQTNDDSLKQRLYYRKRDMMNKLSVRKSSGDTLTQREENLVSLGDRLKTLEARARGKAAAAKKAENAGNAAKAQNLRTQYYRMRMDYMTIGIQQG